MHFMNIYQSPMSSGNTSYKYLPKAIVVNALLKHAFTNLLILPVAACYFQAAESSLEVINQPNDKLRIFMELNGSMARPRYPDR
jgi:hypothetical protein